MIIGTSGDKAALFREDGTLIKSIIAEYQPTIAPMALCEQNPEEWWKAVCESTREILGYLWIKMKLRRSVLWRADDGIACRG